MATGKTLFNPSSIGDLSKKVEEGTYTVPTTLSREIISFLICMLQYESEKRLSVEELATHPFLTKNIREFSKINIEKLSKYIDHKGLNINIKENTTIWSILNEIDEDTDGRKNPLLTHLYPFKAKNLSIEELNISNSSNTFYKNNANNYFLEIKQIKPSCSYMDIKLSNNPIPDKKNNNSDFSQNQQRELNQENYEGTHKCEACGIKTNIKEKDDHLLCHELEKEFNNNIIIDSKNNSQNDKNDKKTKDDDICFIM